MKFLLFKIRLWFRKLRWGKITSKVKDHIDQHPCEIEYYDRKGRVIGYWAYGHFEPNLPYQGELILKP